MHPHLKSLLVKAGCDAKASDGDAQKFYDDMSADKKKGVDVKLAKLMEAGEGDDAALADPTPPGEPTPAELAAKIQTAKANLAALEAKHKPAPASTIDDDALIIAAEEKRAGNIRRLAALHKAPDDLVNRLIGENMTIEKARVAILKHVAENAKPIDAAVTVGENRQLAALRAAIPQAITLRSGVADGDTKRQDKMFELIGEKRHEMTASLQRQTLLDMFRTYLVALGVAPQEIYSLSRAQLAESIGPRGLRQKFPRVAALAESTSDFSNITLDAINKALRFNYLDAKRTWPIWAEKKFANDFKTINSIALSEAPSMKSSNEGGEIKYVSLTDSKETAKLVTYKAGIKLTRNAIINDDLDAFNSIPRLQANSAARLEDDVAYAMLTANANMSDTNALFSVAHLNLTASGGAPSVANLQIGATAMMKQKGLAGAARLELEPKFLLVPTSIVEQTKELVGSQKLIASQSSSGSVALTVGDNNPFYNRYQVVGSTRLDDASVTKWYLLADYRDGQVNTFQLYFLTDEPEPVLRQETDFDTEDVKYLVRHTVVGLIPDFRGAYANNGA